jgi:hypothetical protein
VGGALTSHDIPHHRGVTAIVQEKYQSGATDVEVVAHLAAVGIVHRIGKLVGQSYDAPAIQNLIRRMKLQRPFDALAHPIIRERRAAGITHQAIADELNIAGIRHRLGRWNRHRVVTVALRFRRDQASQPAPPLRLRVLELHKQRLSPPQIAKKLAAEGVTTSRGTAVTVNAVEAVFRQLET